jgi:hypothetical protein
MKQEERNEKCKVQKNIGGKQVKMRTIYVTGIIALVSVAMVLAAVPVSAQPTAESFGVGDASGDSGTYVEVPVTITNVRNGPVQGIRLRVDYNENVLNLTSINNGDLTSAWTALQLGVDRHTITIATAYTDRAIPNGRSGSVVLLNFHVIGSQGATSPMSMTLIELSNPDGVVGTAPARNGLFTVTPSGEPTPTPTPPAGGGGGGGGFVPTSPTPTATPTSTVTVTPTPTLAPATTPSTSATPISAPTPSPAPIIVIPWLIMLMAIVASAIIVSVAYLVLRRKRR